jgi:GTP-binding protein Era
VQQKLSITSRKPQTTRHRILGVQTYGAYQYIYVDTPGIQKTSKNALHRWLNKTAQTVLADVDVVVFVVDKTYWKEEDEVVLQLIKKTTKPCILVINKIDKVQDKASLLPFVEKIRLLYSFHALFAVSAKTGLQVKQLEKELQSLLLPNPHFFAEDQYTDRPLRFLCAELLREKIFRYCGQELPYSVNVEIESFQEEETLVRISALIWVEKPNHKSMIIGEKGQKIKEMATMARKDMEALLQQKVFLQCFCKVKAGWSDDERMLIQLGYGN